MNAFHKSGQMHRIVSENVGKIIESIRFLLSCVVVFLIRKQNHIYLIILRELF